MLLEGVIAQRVEPADQGLVAAAPLGALTASAKNHLVHSFTEQG
jgi:hypothetical protein